MSVVWINNEKCKECHTCVRSCPTKAISITSDDSAEINSDRCIGCGNCYVVCNSGAVEFRDETVKAEKLLNSEAKVAAIVAPSIAAEFPDVTDHRNFVGMIRSLGFEYVHEVSFGADLVSHQLKKIFDNAKGRYFITANCPPVVDYIRKFQPKLIDNLTPLVSPMTATAMVMKALHGEDIRLVYLGPCLGQKAEADLMRDSIEIDAVLSFRELREMFKKKNITENSVEFSEFDPPFGRKGSLFPISNGILQAGNISEDLSTSRIITIEGKDQFKPALDDFADIAAIKHHYNQFYCEGCAMGPLTTQNKVRKQQRHSLVVNYSNKRLSITDKKQWEKDLQKFEKLDLSRKFTEDVQRLPDPNPAKVKEVLQLLGQDRSLNINCQLCGYESCHDFAVDVAKGLSKPEMCVNFAMRNRQEYIQKLQASNRQLAKTQKALKESEQRAREEHEAVREAMQMTTSMMQKLPSGVVIVDKDLRIIQSNNRFIDILGEEAHNIADVIPGLETADLRSLLPYNVVNLFSYVLQNNKPVQNRDIALDDIFLNISIFTIKRKEIVGAVIRDLYEPAVRKEEVIARVQEVIDKNLEMVQKIGFLLGEGASETEQMLNTIIESFSKQSGENNKE
ncbi:MAG: [Fe-Fe] hydrogenase large subunit C-terminal domain-containing protein [Bacteroidota bacterium]